MEFLNGLKKIHVIYTSFLHMLAKLQAISLMGSYLKIIFCIVHFTIFPAPSHVKSMRQPILTAVWLENCLNLKIGIFKWFEKDTCHLYILFTYAYQISSHYSVGIILKKIRFIMGRSWEIGEMNNTKYDF